MVRRFGGAARGLVFGVILIGVAAAFYAYRKTQSSNRIKSEMLAIFDDMHLAAEWRGEINHLFLAAHDQAYANALDISKKHGSKFDVQAYYDEVCDLIIRWAREEGKDGLADRLDRERGNFTLRVTER